MPKGYWIAHIEVADPARYRTYVDALPGVIARHGGKFLIAGGRFETQEGSVRPRTVAIEFESYEQARACWNSDEYKKVAKLREGAAAVDVVIVEGL
jgi:uncharacterized protein (DUF1330 family)